MYPQKYSFIRNVVITKSQVDNNSRYNIYDKHFQYLAALEIIYFNYNT